MNYLRKLDRGFPEILLRLFSPSSLSWLNYIPIGMVILSGLMNSRIFQFLYKSKAFPIRMWEDKNWIEIEDQCHSKGRLYKTNVTLTTIWRATAFLKKQRERLIAPQLYFCITYISGVNLGLCTSPKWIAGRFVHFSPPAIRKCGLTTEGTRVQNLHKFYRIVF